MDSVLLDCTQNSQIQCKNTASNTNPIACASCGSNNYVQILSQANCIKTLYSDSPNFVNSDTSEENFTTRQPMFSNPSYFPHFFNNSIPSNLCFGLVDSRFFASNSPSEKEKNKNEENNLASNKSAEIDDGVKEKNQNLENKNYLVEATGPFTSQCFNPYFQGCGCNNSLPWTCSPFLVPIISYYVLWNSQKANSNPSNLKLKPNENSITKQPPENEISEEKLTNEQSSTFINEYSQTMSEDVCTTEEKLVDESELYDSDSRNYFEENTESNKEYIEHTDENNKKLDEMHEDEIKLDISTPTSHASELELVNQDYREKSEEMIVNKSPNVIKSKTKVSLEVDLQFCSTNSLDSTEQTFEGDSLICEQEYNTETSKIHMKDKTPVKKIIKNFTITDELHNEILEESHNLISASAAAGDLEKNVCVGYKINIEPSDSETKGFKRAKSFIEFLENKDSQIKENIEIVHNEKKLIKSPRNQKSGIAKLTNKSKFTQSKSENFATKKEEKKLPANKRKHDCLTKPESVQSTVRTSKLKNSKTSTETEVSANQKTVIVPGKEKKVKSSKMQPLRTLNAEKR